MKANSIFTAAAVLCWAQAAHAGGGGALGGGATEWTQLANNAELASILGVESEHLGVSVETLSAELDQLRTQMQTLETMIRNSELLPDAATREMIGQFTKLQEIMREAGAVARDGATIDNFLRSDAIEDPLFDRSRITQAGLNERYNIWQGHWDGVLSSSLGQVGLTVSDVETETALIDTLNGQLGTEIGHMQAMQLGNQLAGSAARSMSDLRLLTAAQTQLNSVAWGRQFAIQDQREAEDRAFQDQLQKDMDALEAVPPGRSLNEIFFGRSD